MNESFAATQSDKTKAMNAVVVHQFGGLDALVYEPAPRPAPQAGQVLVRVKAAGVGPWDALIRSGQSGLPQPLPLIPGSDVAGFITAAGSGVTEFQSGEEVFGVTNALFTGGYAEYAVADADRITRKPTRLSYAEAAAAPVVAVTAWQMLFDYGRLDGAQRVLVLGAGGSLGACAVQLAKRAGAEVLAVAFAHDLPYVRALGADHAIDAQAPRFEDIAPGVDIVIDAVGGATLDHAVAALKPGGVLVSAVTPFDPAKAAKRGIRAEYFIVSVHSGGLRQIAALLESGELTVRVGEVLPLEQARRAHEMLAGAPHQPGKIVLAINGEDALPDED